MVTDSFHTHTLSLDFSANSLTFTLTRSVAKWSGFQACPVRSHAALGDGWWCLESSCASLNVFKSVCVCARSTYCMRPEVLLSLWPPFPLLYSSPFPSISGQSDTLANTAQCPVCYRLPVGTKKGCKCLFVDTEWQYYVFLNSLRIKILKCSA